MITTAVLAIVPVVVLITLGTLLRRYQLMAESFWPQAERLCYFLLLPALFAYGLASADLRGLPIPSLAAALIGATALVSVILLLVRPRLQVDGAAFTSVFQGGIRFNNYIGVTAAIGLFGSAAIPLAALVNAIIVPTVNVLCVLVFARHGHARPTLRGVVRGIALNPLILGCAIGMVLQLTDAGIPPGIDSAVRALGQASLPIGLMCVGAAFDRRALGNSLRPALIASAVKFGLLPLVTLGTCLAMGLDSRVTAMAILFQALPTASSSYVMARQLGGDAPLMAAIIALQTVLALAVLPLVSIAILTA